MPVTRSPCRPPSGSPAYSPNDLPVYRGGGGAADPISILGAKLAAWYDPSDLSTLFQDSAGTTPVTADGQPVGLMRDKSGNGWHASQSVDASRPVYHTDGTLHWVSLDGADDFFNFGPVDLNNGAFVFGMRDTTAVTGSKALISQGAAGYIATFSAPRDIGINSGGVNQAVDTPTTFPISTKRVFRINKNLGTLSVTDGTLVEHTNSVAGTTGGLVSASALFAFSSAADFPMAAEAYSIILCNDNLDVTETTQILDYVSGKTGV